MQRRVFFAGLVVALFGAGAALASDYQSSVLAQLRAQGFDEIKVETTWLGRLKITAQRRGAEREIILNPRSGEILRDILSTRDGAIRPRISDDSDDMSEGTSDQHSSGSSGGNSGSGSSSSGSSSSGSSGSSGKSDSHSSDSEKDDGGDDHGGEAHD